MPLTALPDENYRIRQAGAKSEIANQISNGKKCFYVQIGTDLSSFASLELAQEFVKGKGLVPDAMSLDYGMKAEPEDTEAEAETEEE